MSSEYIGTTFIISPFSWDIEALNKSTVPPSRRIVADEQLIATRCKKDWQLASDALEYPKRRCTSGVNAVIYFMEKCAEVNVFGLYTGDICDHPYHYYDHSFDCTVDKSLFRSAHNFTHEHAMFAFYSRILPKLNLYP